jgi:1,4-alpha-glucan branching enzyme
MSGLLYGTSELVGTPGSELDRIVTGEHHDPHSVLGAHPARDADGQDVVVIRGWRPDASTWRSSSATASG